MPLLLDADGNITETTGANIFVVRNDVIYTPPDGHVLDGISRDVVLELAAEARIPVKKAPLSMYDLLTASEAFITGTSYCLLPVASLNDQRIGTSVPGPLAESLLKQWDEQLGLDIAAQALANV
jgi:branched-subunit amino acid aminotransferase/4-amino-4-deoxychorismate lyase